MEFEKQSMNRSWKKANAMTQITLDDDSIIPDSRPDAVRVIHTMGTLTFEEPKATSQGVWMKGRMDFFVLYRTDKQEDRIETLSGSIPFQEKIMMEGVEETDFVRLEGEIEDLSVNLINSRKLDVRALLEIRAFAEKNKEEEIASAVLGDGHYEQKIREETMLNLAAAKKDILRVRNEIALPNAKPNIGKLLWQSICPQNMTSELSDGVLCVSGNAQISVLYRADEEEQIQWFETSVPFHGEIDCSNAKSTDVFWAKFSPDSMELEAREDYDGEERLLGMELVFGADIKVWREETIPVLEDLFAIDREVETECEDTVCNELLVKNHAKIRMGDQMRLEREKEKILQICGSCGTVHIDEAVQKPEGIYVSGVLAVDSLYVTADDNYPVAHIQDMLSFEQLIEVPEMSDNVIFELDCGVDQISVNLLDSTSYEIKAVISLAVLAVKERHFCRITGAKEAPLDTKRLNKQPGITGYIVKPGEELWNIAKAYHTTVQELMETNDLKTQTPEAGSRIMIVKKVG